MRFFTCIFVALVFLLSCSLVSESCAAEKSGAAALSELQVLADQAQEMNRRLSHMEGLLENLVRPQWEYRVVVPNMMNTSNMGEHTLDGIDLNKLGKTVGNW